MQLAPRVRRSVSAVVIIASHLAFLSPDVCRGLCKAVGVPIRDPPSGPMTQPIAAQELAVTKVFWDVVHRSSLRHDAQEQLFYSQLHL